MHITHVKTNAKVGADVEIGPKTLIVGRNGSGKSTIINAVELALTARVSDVAGRTDVARPVDVLSLAPKGATTLSADVTFDDGTVAGYMVSGTTAKAKKATHTVPPTVDVDLALPFRTLKDAVLGSPATARKFLLAQIAGKTSRAEVKALLPTDELAEMWEKQAAPLSASISTPDALLLIVEKAGEAQREASAKAKTSREAAKVVGGGRAAPPSRQELAEATAKKDAAREAWSAAQSASKPVKVIPQESIDALAKEAEAVVTLHAMSQAKLANWEPPKPPHPAFPSIASVMEASIEAGGECLVCGGSKVTPDDLAFVRDSLKDYDAESAERQNLVQEVWLRDAESQKIIDKVESLEKQRAEQLAHNAKVESEPGADVDALRDALDAAEAALTDLKVVADAWAASRKAEATATQAEADAEKWKTFKAACEGVIGVVLGQALKAFVGKVQSYLPPDDVFDLILTDGDREVVSFGLVRDGHLNTALSGAEWARVMGAMASACAGSKSFGVIIPEERAFDPETLTDVMESFQHVPHQVILASPVPPASIPQGWTVIERSL